MDIYVNICVDCETVNFYLLGCIRRCLQSSLSTDHGFRNSPSKRIDIVKLKEHSKISLMFGDLSMWLTFCTRCIYFLRLKTLFIP